MCWLFWLSVAMLAVFFIGGFNWRWICRLCQLFVAVLTVLIIGKLISCVDQWLLQLCQSMVGEALSINGGCIGCVDCWRMIWSWLKVAVSAVLIVNGCVGCDNQLWLQLCRLVVNQLAMLIDGGCCVPSAVHMSCCSEMLSIHLLMLGWCCCGRYFFWDKDTSHQWRQHKCKQLCAVVPGTSSTKLVLCTGGT